MNTPLCYHTDQGLHSYHSFSKGSQYYPLKYILFEKFPFNGECVWHGKNTLISAVFRRKTMNQNYFTSIIILFSPYSSALLSMRSAMRWVFGMNTSGQTEMVT